MQPDELATSLSMLYDMNDPPRREEAWRLFLERYRPLLNGWCARKGLPPGERDDVIASVLLRLVQSLGAFQVEKRKGPGSFRAWLRTVVENTVRGAYRDRLRHPGDRGV